MIPPWALAAPSALLARSQWAPGTSLRGPAEVRPIRIASMPVAPPAPLAGSQHAPGASLKGPANVRPIRIASMPGASLSFLVRSQHAPGTSQRRPVDVRHIQDSDPTRAAAPPQLLVRFQYAYARRG